MPPTTSPRPAARARPPLSARLCPACLLLCLAAPAARAQQPFYTDDAEVTERGRYSFQLVNELDVLPREVLPARAQHAANATLAYGLLRGVEVSVSAPVITVFNERGARPRTPAGLGDTSLQLKYNFLREREGSRRPALAVSFAVELPTGSVAKGLGSGLFDYSLNGIIQKTLTARSALRLNGGLVFAGNTTTGAVGLRTRGLVFTGGSSLTRRFTRRLSLGAEVTGAMTGNLDLSRGQLQGQVGGNLAVRKNFTLDFGLIAGRFAASPRAGAQLGFTIDF